MHHVFVTGATGYMGRPFVRELVSRGHRVSALARRGSEPKVPPGATVVVGDALDAATYQRNVAPADTLVHLVGVAHPSPAKAAAFRSIDLASTLAAIEAARFAGVRHFVYVSVAHPAPVMKQYVAARQEGEARLADSGLAATILRPWYVLGPGHWWPLALLPFYWLASLSSSSRDTAKRLGLVKHRDMVRALFHAVETPAIGTEIFDVSRIRDLGRYHSELILPTSS